MLTTEDELELAKYRSRLARADRRVQQRVRDLQEILPGGDPPEALIAFVHIPKTAGHTVTSMFRAAYTRKSLHKSGNYLKSVEGTERKVTMATGGWENWHRRGGRVTVGHVPLSLFRRQLPAGTRYITFLREPIDRVLSHYYRHIRQQDPSRAGVIKPGAGAKVKADSIEQALLELRMPQLNNLATRFLCGHEPIGELPDSALDDAKENLRGFAFVGMQGRFEESLVLLQRMLGLGAVPYVDRHVSDEGARPAVDEIPDEQRALIEDCNRLDAELYRFGLTLFEKSVQEAGDGFEAAVEELRARDRAAREGDWRQTVDENENEPRFRGGIDAH